ncbi:uncharacterized protein LOC133721560 isoform X1 [Rosa rugosa]|uniref:uncharacterized protein LOC133721560 isoform X1 n=1 Tax=Rosa rugosa TaxID=74645 RepID=UPI002B40A5AB|nr:uncharacterized protein LOC133721560 isoform X1 [Rosa rugosa]XP_062004193.1 uncharacterized protein LOC133721560 isoform X1 [Rosa rugosa]
MGKPSLSLRLTLLFSFSLTASYSFTPSSSFPTSLKQSSPSPKATPSDLLSLLGPKSQSSSVEPLLAQELTSCFKFLVPFRPNAKKLVPEKFSGRKFLTFKQKGQREEEEDRLVWWPPQPVLELARLAVDSGGDPAAIQRALDPTMITVPDVEGSEENRCQLTRTPYGRHFISEELNSYIGFLFELILARGPTVGLNVSLNRYDLFHGHLFLALDTGRLGILFHAKEYPAYDKELFPYNMGFCQRGSNVTYDDSMNLRNILWLAPLPSNSAKGWEAPGVLVVLNARPDGIIYRDLIPEYVNFARTIYEDDLGEVAVDVNYLAVGNPEPRFQLFIC